jgi:hypothetical protein
MGMKGDFTRDTRWPRPLDPDRLWHFLLDETSMARCSPHVEGVEPNDAGWTARLVSHVGRLRFAAPVEVQVRDQAHGSYVEIEAHGEDTRIGTRLHVRARLDFVPVTPFADAAPPPLVEAHLGGTYEVRGRAANLAPGIVHRHAGVMVDAFWERFTISAASTAGVEEG